MERLEDCKYALIIICKDANNNYPYTSVDTQDTVDALCVNVYTSSQLFKREGDCSVNIHVWILFAFL